MRLRRANCGGFPRSNGRVTARAWMGSPTVTTLPGRGRARVPSLPTISPVKPRPSMQAALWRGAEPWSASKQRLRCTVIRLGQSLRAGQQGTAETTSQLCSVGGLLRLLFTGLRDLCSGGRSRERGREMRSR